MKVFIFFTSYFLNKKSFKIRLTDIIHTSIHTCQNIYKINYLIFIFDILNINRGGLNCSITELEELVRRLQSKFRTHTHSSADII